MKDREPRDTSTVIGILRAARQDCSSDETREFMSMPQPSFLRGRQRLQ